VPTLNTIPTGLSFMNAVLIVEITPIHLQMLKILIIQIWPDFQAQSTNTVHELSFGQSKISAFLPKQMIQI
jgi:hypothetical protein